MQNIYHYDSLLGGILLAADDEGLTGLWFDGQKYFGANLKEDAVEKETPVLCEAIRWLDIYFSGVEPDFRPRLHLTGTEFQMRVWKLLCRIPYGQIVTYGDLAKSIASECGRKTMSARAVGGAVGRNPVSVIVPCHRVVGTNGSLTGYAGGIDRKRKLLELEHANERTF